MKRPDLRRRSAALEILPRLRARAAPDQTAGAAARGGPERDSAHDASLRVPRRTDAESASTRHDEANVLVLNEPDEFIDRLRIDLAGVTNHSVHLNTRLERGRPEFPTLLNVSVVAAYRRGERAVRLVTYCGQSMSGGDPDSRTTESRADSIRVDLHRQIVALGLTVRTGARGSDR